MLEALLVAIETETVCSSFALEFASFLQQRCRQQGDNHKKGCCLCGDTNTSLFGCCGKNNEKSSHCFCRDCLELYAKTAFRVGGDYEKTQTSTCNGLVVTSKPGELPCPFLGCGECHHTNAFSERMLRMTLSDDAFAMWMGAVGRVATEKARLEKQKTANLKEKNSMTLRVEDIKVAVEEALSMGAKMTCPGCLNHGEKDDACMHISCEICDCNWCYCCGNPVEYSDDDDDDGGNEEEEDNEKMVCPSCDYHDSFLEGNAGWNEVENNENETAGYNALHEFHRQKMAYFVRKIKEAIRTQGLWEEFERTHPDMLQETPTPNRCILWDEIDSAKPPMFGRASRPEQLRWIHDMDDIVQDLRKRQEVSEEPAARFFEEPQPPVECVEELQPPPAQLFEELQPAQPQPAEEPREFTLNPLAPSFDPGVVCIVPTTPTMQVVPPPPLLDTSPRELATVPQQELHHWILPPLSMRQPPAMMPMVEPNHWQGYQNTGVVGHRSVEQVPQIYHLSYGNTPFPYRTRSRLLNFSAGEYR